MAVTRSTAAERSQTRTQRPPAGAGKDRGAELLWLFMASVVVLAGIVLTFLAKAPSISTSAQALNLNTVERREQLLPAFCPDSFNFLQA